MDAARELRELRRIERWLTTDDPELAAALSAHGAAPRQTKQRWARFTICAVGAVCVVLGALTATFLFVFTGVLALMVGACLHVLRRSRRRGHSR
ncbi:DUF3040 domain-containing protein [Lentzea sp. NBRC 102530]|uniref:DUF3040 domain-containing protein n=1 Tax=Lentzea sp. NBRC 102530 TaxID=3032201 RepID=UPI0024A4E135|nr:DUF3040 domain-containing protein [Lentzea sp. NBRC 102530]GLY50379.1 hypothetical protein Lesp01_40350 [Lentzea sp. NBRC 102530]